MQLESDGQIKFTKWSRFLGALSLILLVAAVAFIRYYQRESSPGGDFNLTYNGAPWRLSDHAKKLNLFYSGYVKCPDVCPMTMSVASRAFKQLSENEKKDVSFLFLSVDSDHDRPEDVAIYARQFDPNFIGLSGSRDQIDQVTRMYHASYIIEDDPKSHLGYGISHADRIFVLDHNGKQLASLQNPRSVDELLTAIRKYL